MNFMVGFYLITLILSAVMWYVSTPLWSLLGILAFAGICTFWDNPIC